MAGSEEEGQAYTATIFVFKTSAGIDSKNSHRFIGEVSSTGVALLKDWRACATALWFEALLHYWRAGASTLLHPGLPHRPGQYRGSGRGRLLPDTHRSRLDPSRPLTKYILD